MASWYGVILAFLLLSSGVASARVLEAGQEEVSIANNRNLLGKVNLSNSTNGDGQARRYTGFITAKAYVNGRKIKVRFMMEDRADLLAGDITFPSRWYVPNAKKCAVKCAKRLDCFAFTFNSLERACVLKQVVGWTKVYNYGRVTGYRQ